MVKSIRELAEDFDKRSGALMTDGRRTLADISRAVNNFDRNPTRVIFGGGNTPGGRPGANRGGPAEAGDRCSSAAAAERAEAAVVTSNDQISNATGVIASEQLSPARAKPD